MTEEELIFGTLRQLVDDRVFPDVAPTGTAPPYITYQDVGGVPLSFLDGAAPSRENTRVQLSVWSETRIEAKQLLNRAKTALMAASGAQTTEVGRPTTDFDHETNLRCARQDLSIWCST